MSGSQAAFLGLLAAVGVHRLAEVAVSLRNARGRAAAFVREPVLFPLMALLHVALIVLPAAEVLGLDLPLEPGLAAVAAAGLLAATALRVAALRALGRAWNVGVVVPEAAVVTSGPYAWIRHPNYLVVIVEVACFPLLHGAWRSALLLSLWNALVLARRIQTEEAALQQLPAWRGAMAGKARLVPGVF